MPAAFVWFLFDWRGRIGRSAYRRAVLVLAVVVAALQIAPEKLRPVLVGVLALQIVVQAALDAKRLHDIGMSASWVVATSVVGVAAAAGLGMGFPEAMQLMTGSLRDAVGPTLAAVPGLAIVASGLGGAALARSTLLWMPNGNAAGDAYAHDPLQGRRAAAAADTPASLDADAAIARALAERARALSEKRDEMRAAARPAAGARKTFGRRSA